MCPLAKWYSDRLIKSIVAMLDAEFNGYVVRDHEVDRLPHLDQLSDSVPIHQGYTIILLSFALPVLFLRLICFSECIERTLRSL
jgi:hypothetical protein